MNRPTDVHGRPDPPLMIVRADASDRPAVTVGQPKPPQDPQDQQKSQNPQESREAALRAQLRERTADLQRVKAEYDNYRKRVRRDRLAVREVAVANVLRGLLPVVDAVAEAAEQGEVTGGFERVAGLLESELAALGLESFGTSGDPFDPFVHEAVSYAPTDQVDRPTCTAVLRQGHRVGNQLLRPAQVVVAEPRTVR